MQVAPAYAAAMTGFAEPSEPLSRVLVDLGRTMGERTTFGELVAALSHRSFAALMILFAAPNLLPLPPGASTVLGLPLVLISAQLCAGRERVWLPAVLRNRSLDRTTYEAMIGRLAPILRRFERFVRPRSWPVSDTFAQRFVGFVVLMLAVILALPIPGGNAMPALATVLLGLALGQHDGVWLLIGTAVAVISLAIVAGVLGILVVLVTRTLG